MIFHGLRVLSPSLILPLARDMYSRFVAAPSIDEVGIVPYVVISRRGSDGDLLGIDV